MDLNNMNEDWKREVPALAAMEKTNPFTVPENYFDELSEQLQTRIRIEALANKDAGTTFKIPEAYFDTLEDRIYSSIRFETLREDLPADGFSVPDRYFESLQERIIENTSAKTEGGAIVRRLVPGWIKYAAAACITTFIGLAVYQTNFQPADAVHSQLSEIPDEAIVKYLQVSSGPADGATITESFDKMRDLSALSPDLSDKEIENYLESTL